MTHESLLEQIRKEHEKNKKIEKRIRNWLIGIMLTFGLAAVSMFGKVMVIDSEITTMQIELEKIKYSYVSQESFIIFNRTYELQLQEIQATLNGNNERLKEIQSKYRELRSMLVEYPQYKGGIGSQK